AVRSAKSKEPAGTPALRKANPFRRACLLSQCWAKAAGLKAAATKPNLRLRRPECSAPPHGGRDFRTRHCIEWGHDENRWACFVMQAGAYSELSELDLMKLCVWREARGEGILAKRGVGH